MDCAIPQSELDRARAEKSLRDHFELLSPDDLALLVGVNPTALQKWRTEGNGPAYVKLGKQVFYHRQQVRDWITKNQVPSAP